MRALLFHYRMKGVVIVKVHVVRRREGKRYGDMIWVILVVAERREEEGCCGCEARAGQMGGSEVT